jgi:hypothetical protein
MSAVATDQARQSEPAVTTLKTAPERLPTEPEAIFIVGVARSGTTMMRYLLEASDRIAIARENHFMGHVFGRRGARHFFSKAGDLADDNAVRKIVDMIYSGEYERQAGWRRPSPYWYWLKDEFPREELERRLLAAPRTERGMFEVFLRAYADVNAKPVMGEKTPTHLNYVDTLLEWFPRARVIHMLRDPRAIYVSDRYRRQNRDRWPYTWIRRVPLLLESYLLLLTVVTWPRALRQHRRLAKAYPGRYVMIRFEDVVRKPAETLPPLFEFLGVAMPASISTDVTVPQQHGMRSSDEGIDPKAADRWRERIQPAARKFIELFLRGPMRRHGYID